MVLKLSDLMRYTLYEANDKFVSLEKEIEYVQIRYIESDRDYVRLFLEEDKLLFHQSLKYWEEILPDEKFSRVHKSYILNIEKITQISGNRVIAGEDVILIGRSYKEVFLKKINVLIEKPFCCYRKSENKDWKVD